MVEKKGAGHRCSNTLGAPDTRTRARTNRPVARRVWAGTEVHLSNTLLLHCYLSWNGSEGGDEKDMQTNPSNSWVAAVAMGVVVASATTPMLAQSRKEIKTLIEQLAPSAQPVLTRLAELNELKAEDWRFHLGDLAHGEAMNLDDTSWQMTHAGSEAPKDAVWYRSVIAVPKLIHGYDPTGASIWFSFRASSREDVPEIINVNGKRLALGADLEPISLTENAKPGDRFLVAVKLLATSRPKKFEGAVLRVDYAQNRPNPHDLGSEICRQRR